MSKTLESVIFLSMNGRCKEAIEFYKKHFNAKVEMLVTYGMIKKMDSSFDLKEEEKELISHSIITIGNTKLMLAENTMNITEVYVKVNNFSICIQSADKKEIENFYKSTIKADGVRIIRPLSEIVFSEVYGIIEDPFGVQIQLMYDKRLK